MPPWAQWLIALAGPGSLSVLLVRIARRWEYCGIVQGFWIRAGRWSGFSCATGGLSWRPVLWLSVVAVLGPAAALAKADAPDEVRAWIEADLEGERRLDPVAALGHFRRAETARPGDAFLHQKIAKQLTDAAFLETDNAVRQRLALEALGHARRSVELAPDSAVNRLSPAPVDGEEAP